MATTKVNNPIEGQIYRNKYVENHTAFSRTIDNSTGREYYNETHRSGSHRTFTNVSTIECNVNNKQELTKGDRFKTVEGGDYSIAQSKENRVYGDYTILTGSPELYNTQVVTQWLEEYSEIAAAKSQFEQDRGGFTNNSQSELPMKGTPDAESGSTQGQTFPENEAHKNMQDLLISKQEKLTEIERRLGDGGSIIIGSGKNIAIMAGFASTSFDSAAIDPKGRKVSKGFEYDGDKKLNQTYTSAAYVEDKDTASNVPFGNLTISAGTGINFKTGAGGVSFTGAGKIEIGGTGSTIIGGAQVLIGASAGGGVAGSVIIKSPSSVEIDSAAINLKSGTVFVETGLMSVKGNETITGDVIVGGNLTVIGNILCKGNLHVEGKITTDTYVFAETNIATAGNINAFSGEGGGSGLSFKDHVHKDVEAGSSNSGIPVR